MSNPDRPDISALDELDEVVRRLTDELAGWRRRALTAEQDREAKGHPADAVAGRERIVSLEGDKAELTKRVDAATERLRALLARLTFLEEQAAQDDAAR